ncbi:MAG: cyclic di-GMP phosphodiesterase response regulator RpfG [Paenibacillus sp.]|nr:cyclic di-GMP phosphodiesterase response regulator RpfG [Paenibacillus sp.]
MKFNALLNTPVQQLLLALIGIITSLLMIIGLVDTSLGSAYDIPENIWIALAITACSWGMYGIQRRMSAYRKLGEWITLVYPFLMLVFVSVYIPELVAQLWCLLLFYPIMISMMANFKLYRYASAAFLLYFTLYTIYMLPDYIDQSDDATLTASLLRIVMAVGSVLLGAVLLAGQNQLKRRNEAVALRQQKQQVLNILECFIPVGERKTQTSRKEINEMSRLVKALWLELGHGARKDWEIDLLSMLHYVSRVKLPDYMFEKAGKLSGFELEVVQEHCFMAKELCDGIPAFEEIQSTFLYHHEKIDGTGYPFQLSGDRIPLLSQALGLVEVYMAMTAPRSYREAMSEQDAFMELREMQGEYFRTDLVDALGRIIRAAA